MIDTRTHLETLVGQEIETLTNRQGNRIMRIEGDVVIVATEKSPAGQAVPIRWLEDAAALLVRDGEVVVNVETLGYRSAFVGAFLATLPGVVVTSTVPKRVALVDRGMAA